MVSVERKAYDIVVAGGGISGVCAAIAAARHGARTALVQERSVLGGNASSEIRMHICGADHHGTRPDARETGILMEILLENKRRNPNHSFSTFDTILWEKCRFQENLDLYLNTRITEGETAGGRIRQVTALQSTTEKQFALEAAFYVDATGDGFLAAGSGAEVMCGREGRNVYGEEHAPGESDTYTMGNSLMFRAVDTGEPVAYKRPFWAEPFDERKLKTRDIGEITSGYWWIELGGDGRDCIADGEEIRDELLGAVYGIWDYIKNSGKYHAENYALEWVGCLPGKRETRRIRGDYVLREQDLVEGRIFPDAVAYGGWPMDMHIVGGLRSTLEEPTKYIYLKDVYTIPYRCLYSANVENLFLAGRAISVSHMAFGSTRVMGTCGVIGQAVGTAAAIAVREGVNPRQVGQQYIRRLQQMLLADDCYIPGCRNEDTADKLNGISSVICSGEQADGACSNVTNGVSRRVKGESNCWISGKLDRKGQWIRLQLAGREEIRQIHIKFDPDLTKQIMPSLSDAQRRQQEKGMPGTLVRDYRVELLDGTRCVWKCERKDNGQRLCIHSLPEGLTGNCIRITVTATYGDAFARIFEIRAYGKPAIFMGSSSSVPPAHERQML